MGGVNVVTHYFINVGHMLLNEVSPFNYYLLAHSEYDFSCHDFCACHFSLSDLFPIPIHKTQCVTASIVLDWKSLDIEYIHNKNYDLSQCCEHTKKKLLLAVVILHNKIV